MKELIQKYMKYITAFFAALAGVFFLLFRLNQSQKKSLEVTVEVNKNLAKDSVLKEKESEIDKSLMKPEPDNVEDLSDKETEDYWNKKK